MLDKTTSHNMTLYQNTDPTKHGTAIHTTLDLACDITPSLKLFYNNLHTYK